MLSLSDIIDLATLSVLFLTFIVILFYTIETRISRKVNQKQNFDTNFYNLLSNYQNIVTNLEFREHENIRNIYKGDQFFKRFFDLFTVNYNQSINTYKGKLANEKEFCKVIYDDFYRRYRNYFSHYFLTVSQILKFIDAVDNLDESVKKKYFKIFQSCLTLHELLLLFYHGISHYDNDTYLLLDKYCLLMNISESDIISLEHLNFYNQFNN